MNSIVTKILCVGKSLVSGILFSFAGAEYTRPSLFIAQRAQIQQECETNYMQLKLLVRVILRAQMKWGELSRTSAYKKTTFFTAKDEYSRPWQG